MYSLYTCFNQHKVIVDTFIDDSTDYDHNRSIFQTQIEISSKLGSVSQVGHSRATADTTLFQGY